ncbi:MAG: type II secretion system F family protein, partial [Pseudomonadota bacterium]
MLQQANDFLTAQFGPFGPLLVVGVIGMFMVLLTLPILLNKQEDPLDKLKKSKARQDAGKPPEERLRRGTDKEDKLEKYSDFLEPQDAEEYSAIKLKLLQAGYRDKNAVRTYHFAQFALGAGGLVLGVMYALLLQATQDPSTQQMILSILIPGAV